MSNGIIYITMVFITGKSTIMVENIMLDPETKDLL